VVELLALVEDLLSRGIRVIFLQQNLDLKDLSDPVTKLMLQILVVMAEYDKTPYPKEQEKL
jgi:DNA invertase Pin-like site-specific DNA recombinase